MRMILTDIRIAITALKATKVRTLLTMLGIVIGVASITTVIALGEGAKSAVGSQLANLGSNIITVRPGQAHRDENGNVDNYNLLSAVGATTITERDYESLQSIDSIQTAPMMLINGSVKNGETQAEGSQIVASNENLKNLLNLQLEEGDNFLDESISADTAVIGATLADRLFNTQNALGNVIKLRGKDYTIVGVLKPTTSSTILSGVDLNNAAYVRFDAGKSFNQGIAQVQLVFAQPKNGANVASASKAIYDQMLQNHSGEEDFAVLTPEDNERIASSTLSTLTGITSAIAAISIVVGGIGIMNIMLVSVTERIREIGIRKSVGATNRQILRQFLIEATVMSVGGGIVGIILAYAIAFLIAIQFGFFPAVSFSIIAIAFGISVLTGLIFGSWPAIRAAQKDPIEALRQFQ